MLHDALHCSDATAAEPSAISGLDEIDIREIANETHRDVRTVRKVVRGEPVRGVAGAEIRRAIQARLADREVRLE